MWAVLCEQRAGWRGVQMGPDLPTLIQQALASMPKPMLAINKMVNIMEEKRKVAA